MQKAFPLVSRNAGFFSHFQSAIGFFKFCEENQRAPDIHFDSWHFYDPDRGSSWWGNYFDPTHHHSPNKKPENPTQSDSFAKRMALEGLALPRLEARRLIHKYINVHPAILNKVEQFQSSHFGTRFVLGVHFRGTDKVRTESVRVPYSFIARKVETLLSTLRVSYRIFVASDEVFFINKMRERFGEAVIYTPSLRSSNRMSVHHHANDPYRLGEEVLIDCLLLSRCDYLLRTASNVSAAALQFNPYLETTHLTEEWKDTLSYRIGASAKKGYQNILGKFKEC